MIKKTLLLQELEKARRENDRSAEHFLQSELGNEFFSSGDFVHAVKFYNQALATAHQIGRPRAEGTVLGHLGNVYVQLKELHSATDYYNLSLHTARQIEDQQLEGNALNSLGNVYTEMGELEHAIDYYNLSLHTAQQIEDQQLEGNILNSLGNVYAKMGELEHAIDYYNLSLHTVHQTKDHKVKFATLSNLGDAYAAMREHERAIDYFDQALNMAKDDNSLKQIADYIATYRKRNEACDMFLEDKMSSGKAFDAVVEQEDSFVESSNAFVLASKRPHLRKTRRRFLFQLLIMSTIFASVILAITTFLVNISPSSTSRECNPTQQSTRNAICTVQIDGEFIGISDGHFAFDTHRSSGALKNHAADQLKSGSVRNAVQLWQSAIKIDPADAETQIYLENQHVIDSGRPYITFIAVVTLSGDATSLDAGRNSLQGAYLAQKEFNHDYGNLQDMQARLLIANVGGSSAFATFVSKQIIQAIQFNSNIVGVMGWTDDNDTTFDAIAQLNAAHIPIVSPMSTSNTLTARVPYFFRVAPSLHDQATAAAEYAKNVLHAKTAAIFFDPADFYSTDLTNDFKQHFIADNKHIIVAQEPYTNGHPETIIDLIHAALLVNPDVIYFGGYASDVSVLLNNLPSRGPLVLGGDALYPIISYTHRAQTGFNHLRFTTVAYSSVWDLSEFSAYKSLFFNDYLLTFDPNRSNTSDAEVIVNRNIMLSYDAMLTILTASDSILQSGKNRFTPDNLRLALTEMKGTHSLQGITGQISFGSDGNPIDKAQIVLQIAPDGTLRIEQVLGQFLKKTHT